MATTLEKEVWHRKLLDKGITGQPCKKIRQSLFKNVINAKGLLISRNSLQTQSPIINPWPFMKWGIDLIRPLPIARAQAQVTIVAIDYFTKWVEAEPLSTITEAKCINFIWKNIIYRFGVPHSIVTDNGKQFDNPALREMCQELGIHKILSTPDHPQANGQVEIVNKTIKDNLKKKLE